MIIWWFPKYRVAIAQCYTNEFDLQQKVSQLLIYAHTIIRMIFNFSSGLSY